MQSIMLTQSMLSMLDLIKGYVFYIKRLPLVIIMTQLSLLLFR